MITLNTTGCTVYKINQAMWCLYVYITMRRSRIKERLYYNEMLQNQRASILRWSSPESKSTQSYLAVSRPLTQNPTKEKQMTIQLTLRNSVHTSTCHAISKFIPLWSTLNQNYAHNKLLFWGLEVYEIQSEYSLFILVLLVYWFMAYRSLQDLSILPHPSHHPHHWSQAWP